MATLNSFMGSDKRSQPQPVPEKLERKSVTFTHEFMQFLDMVAVFQSKSRLDFSDICSTALEKAANDSRIDTLAAMGQDNLERALRLSNPIVNSHRKTRIQFLTPGFKVHRIFWIPADIHGALAAKAFACGVPLYIFLQIHIAKAIVEDNPDFVKESLGKSLSGIQETLRFWDEWLDDQIQTQQEILTRIIKAEKPQ